MSVIMNYYRHIDRTRIQFEFLCFLPCEDTYEEEIVSLGGKVHFVQKPTSIQGINSLVDFFKAHKNRYQWLHNHEVYLSFLLKPLASQYKIKQFIVHSHTTQYSDRPLSAIRNRFLCMPIQFMKCERFACSEAAGIFLFGHGKKKFKVMPNAIELNRFTFDSGIRAMYRQKLNVEDEFLIGNVGRFVPQKNHKFMISLFGKIHDIEPRTRMVLIGEGPQKDEIQKKVLEFGLQDAVVFAGHRNDIENYLNAMDLFLLPSIYEGLPMSCLEAQASGLPCIISDTITNEVQLSQRVKRLRLDDVESWLRECLVYINENFGNVRTDNRLCSNVIPNICEEARQIMEFYERG